jgi:hypothetical protein
LSATDTRKNVCIANQLHTFTLICIKLLVLHVSAKNYSGPQGDRLHGAALIAT